MHGIQTIRSRGTVDVKAKNAAIGKREFVVDKVAFGDYSFDDSLFELASLKIPDDTRVEDRRKSPPLEYEYHAR